MRHGAGRTRERIDGVLLLDKPVGPSSNDALVRARRLLGAARAGHGGTLDPMASGLLPLMFGEATKFAQDALDADKTYRAELTLGIVTDTADAEGAVVAKRPVHLAPAAFHAALAHFVGEIEQVPPMHSALKRDGKPLYAYARAGIEVERAPRRVAIRSIEVLGLELAVQPPRATVRVTCSKGTYIRTLAADIGERLGCGAHLGALRRERVGALSLESAIGLAGLEAISLDERRARLAPVDALIGALPRVDLDAAAAGRFCNGQRLPAGVLGTARAPAGGCVPRVRVYRGERLLGLARWHDGVLAPLRLIAS